MKGLYISIFVLGSLLAQAQTNLYNKLNAFVNSHTKESLSGRLVAINLWSANDKTSRDLNVEFEKAYQTYCNAKLKGGNKGIIVLNICLDSDPVNADIVLKKDAVNKAIKVPADNSEIVNELNGKQAGYNVVFDENGKVIFENLAAADVFNSIHQLITR